MKIVNIDQGSDEWFSLRAQRMTASNAQAIAANGKGLETYITRLMQEYYSSAEPDRYQSKAMERGLDLESSALFAYEAETGKIVEKAGFVIYSDHVGCSPDGLTDNSGIEIKCLEDKNYFQYLLTNKIDTGYEWQMQMQMLICERHSWDYVVYNPNFKKSLVIQTIYPDHKKYDKLFAGFDAGEKMISDIKARFEGVL